MRARTRCGAASSDRPPPGSVHLRPQILSIVCAATLLAGCDRKNKSPSEDQCKSTCEHVATLEERRVISDNASGIHEMQENLEDLEKNVKAEVERVKKLKTVPRPKFETTAEAREKVS